MTIKCTGNKLNTFEYQCPQRSRTIWSRQWWIVCAQRAELLKQSFEHFSHAIRHEMNVEFCERTFPYPGAHLHLSFSHAYCLNGFPDIDTDLRNWIWFIFVSPNDPPTNSMELTVPKLMLVRLARLKTSSFRINEVPFSNVTNFKFLQPENAPL